jgi:hypothetical protein
MYLAAAELWAAGEVWVKTLANVDFIPKWPKQIYNPTRQKKEFLALYINKS